MINSLFSNLFYLFSSFRLVDAIDILLLTVFIYYILKFLKGKQANQILTGIIIIFLVDLLSAILKLNALNWVLNFVITYSIFGLIVIFSDEIKGYLASLGSTFPFKKRETASEESIDSIVDAAEEMVKRRIGALIIFERNVSLGSLIEKGKIIDARISKEIIVSLFYPNNPLHDGAVVISNNRIVAASVVIPLPEEIVERRKNYGTRHLAAISISKSTDCIVLVVSEETGIISTASGGNLTRNYTLKSLKEYLTEELIENAKHRT